MGTRFHFVDRLCSEFWRRVQQSVTIPAESLGVFRWVFGLYSLAFEATHYTFIDLAPRAFFDPPLFSLARLFSGFPPAPFFRVLDIAALIALAAVTIGFRTRAAGIGLLLLKLVGAHFHYSFGKIDHDILFLAILGCMTLSDWGRYYSVDARARSRASGSHERGVMLFAVLLAFGMFSAGLPKALTWIDFDLDTSGVLSWYYPNRFSLARELLLAPELGSAPAWLTEAADYAAPLLEVGAFAALLIARRTWLSWLLAATVFHVLNVLVLNINFVSYAVLYTCFADLSRFGPFCQRWARALAGLTIAMAAWHVFTRILWYGAPVLFAPGPLEAEVAGLYAALPIGAAVALLFARELSRGRRDRSGQLEHGSQPPDYSDEVAEPPASG